MGYTHTKFTRKTTELTAKGEKHLIAYISIKSFIDRNCDVESEYKVY
jgi:hypothetical protein